MSGGKLRFAQPSATRPSSQPASDLLLCCAEGATVAVSSSVLLQATSSEAIAEVLELLRERADPASITRWDAKGDRASTWQAAWNLLSDPTALGKAAGLTWVRLGAGKEGSKAAGPRSTPDRTHSPP